MKYEDYLAKWGELSPVQVTMVEQTGRCSHELGDTFFYKTPMRSRQGYAVCEASTSPDAPCVCRPRGSAGAGS